MLTRLLLANALLRTAAGASAQLLALMVSWRVDRAADGSTYLALAGGAYFAAEIAISPIVGRVADRRGLGTVLGSGAWIGAGAALVSWLMSSFLDPTLGVLAILCCARIVEGAAMACTVPTSLTLLARLSSTTRARRSRVMGAFEVSSLVGMFVGVGLAGPAWDAWRAGSFVAVAVGYFAAALLLSCGWRGLERVHARRQSALGVARSLVSEPGRRGFMLAWLCVNAVVGLWLQHAPHLLTVRDGAPGQRLVGAWQASGVSLVLGLYGLLILVGTAFWAFAASSWPRRRQMSLALIAMMAAVLILGAMNHGGPLVPLTIVLAFLVVLESGFTPAALAHLAEVTEVLDADRNAALAGYSVLLAAGQLLGIALGGVFAALWQLDGLLAATVPLAAVAIAGVRTIPPARCNLDRARA